MPQIHDALFLPLEQRVQPPRLVLRTVRIQEGDLTERRLRTLVDDEYRQVFCRSASAEARRGLDLLLGRETREAAVLGYEVARIIGAELAHGFMTTFARFDLAQLLDLCWRIGATTDDPRVAEMVAFVNELQGPFGLWEYTAQPQVSRWVTFDLLRSLLRLKGGEPEEWISLEPRTPFQAYPRRTERY